MSYAKVRKELAEQRGEEDPQELDKLPCLDCAKPVPRAALALQGGLCRECLDCYCRTGSSPSGKVGGMRTKLAADPRFGQWAAGQVKP